jgi:hypothetical protein
LGDWLGIVKLESFSGRTSEPKTNVYPSVLATSRDTLKIVLYR